MILKNINGKWETMVFTPEEILKYNKKERYVRVGDFYDKVNKKNRPPAGLHYPVEFIMEDKKLGYGVTVRYCEKQYTDGNGKLNQIPETLDFDGTGAHIVQRDEHTISKNWFFQNCPHIRNDNNVNSGVDIMFFKEDRAKEAAKRTGIEEHKAEARHLIYKQWDEATLKSIAKSESITEVEEKSLDEIKMELVVISNLDPKEFVERHKNNNGKDYLALIEKAADAKIIGYIGKKWFFLNEKAEPKENGKIIGVFGNEEPTDKLMEFMRNKKNKDLFETFESLIEKKELEVA